MEEALKWWNEAAHQGESTSIHTLYTLYSTGAKIPKDGVAAYGYLKLIEKNAAKEHQSTIKEKLNELETKFSLSPSQLKQSQEFVTNWVSKPTPLTIKALSALEEPKRFIEREVNR